MEKKTFGFEKKWGLIAEQIKKGEKKAYKVVSSDGKFDIHFFTKKELIIYKTDPYYSSTKKIRRILLINNAFKLGKNSSCRNKAGVEGISEEYKKIKGTSLIFRMLKSILNKLKS